ncbi:hypothetical protein SUGI_1021830 [Cryptomeria japonica]|nr:hypothetical protein SUGI_1021830 [Cryptomeria japonica]
MWVYNDDKPHTPQSKTEPRTEIRIKGYDYTTGVRQFEGDFYVLHGTSGTCIMQAFGASGMGHATALQLRVYDGQLKHYKDEVLASDVYDRWIHLNVIHDADEGKVHVFIDGEEKIVADDRGRATHYFKCGVYTQDNSSHFTESRWKNIKIWTK